MTSLAQCYIIISHNFDVPLVRSQCDQPSFFCFTNICRRYLFFVGQGLTLELLYRDTRLSISLIRICALERGIRHFGNIFFTFRIIPKLRNPSLWRLLKDSSLESRIGDTFKTISKFIILDHSKFSLFFLFEILTNI